LFSADGKSAYEIAVDNGFVGTEGEWLASLKGSSGKNGADAQAETVEDIYAAYVNNGGDLSFEGFLKGFLAGYGDDDVNDVSYAAAVSLRSTVVVRSWFPDNSGSAGAGVIFSLDRTVGSAYVVTNYHVIYDGTAAPNGIEIALYGKEGFTGMAIGASLIGGSAEYDIAVLFVASNNQLKSEFVMAAAIADSDKIYPGDAVLAVGNPSNEGLSVTAGIVSQDSQNVKLNRIDGTEGTQTMRLIRIDAPVNSGNSGGGLFNERGELIGIVNGKMLSVVEQPDGSLIPTNIENIAYAIPTSVAIAVAENVRDKNNGSGSKIVLGVTLAVADSAAVYNEAAQRADIVQKVAVGNVVRNSLAFGKLTLNDQILTVTIKDSDGNVKISKDITRSYQPIELMFQVRAGDRIIFTVKRGNNTIDVSIDASANYFQTF
jgi:serine protease Do